MKENCEILNNRDVEGESKDTGHPFIMTQYGSFQDGGHASDVQCPQIQKVKENL